MTEIPENRAAARLGESHGHVLMLRLAELDVGEAVDRVLPVQGDDHQRHTHSNAHRGGAGARRPAENRAKQDAGRLVEGPCHETAELGVSKRRGRGRAHRFCWGQKRRAAQRTECPEGSRRGADAACHKKHEGTRPKEEVGESVELGVERRGSEAEPPAECRAQHHADGYDDQNQLRVVRRNS